MISTMSTMLRIAALSCGLLFPFLGQAQMLPIKPAAPATETELELAKISSVPELLKRAAEYEAQQDWRRYTYANKRILELRPYGAQVMWNTARGYALQDDKSATYDLLIKLQQQGMKYDPSTDPDFAQVRGTPAYDYIVKGLQANAGAFGSGKPGFTVQSDLELIESLAYDAKTDRFFAASIHMGTVLSVDRTGKTSEWLTANPDDGHYGVFSMAVDPKRRLLWLGTASVTLFDGYLPQEDFGQATLVAVNLDTGKRVEVHRIPFDGRPHVPAALAVAPSGEVYATDAVTPTVYQLKEGKVKVLFRSAALTGLRGIAVSDDHKHIYFSDYETGLYGADLGRSEVFKLTMEKQNLGSIEGLYLKDRILYAVQSGTYPQRIVRAVLDPANPRALQMVFPLEANKPEFISPGYGTFAGDHLYFIANSQLSLYGLDGELVEGAKAQRRVVYASPLNQALPDPPRAAPRAPAAPKPSGS